MNSKHRHPGHHGRDHLGVTLRRWHRRIGLAGALFLAWMAVSGILLNHSGDLSLGRQELHSLWLSRWYGLGETAQTGFHSGSHWLAASAEGAVLDGKPLVDWTEPPLGMARAAPLLAIAGAQHVRLLTETGELVETLDASALPAGRLRRIGESEAGFVVDVDGKSYVSADGESFAAYEGAVRWSAAEALSPAERATLVQQAPGVSVERLLEDLHSGRFFGRGGVWVVDGLGIALVLLALTGFWIWWRRPSPHKRRP